MKPLAGHRVFVRFDDGVQGEIDLAALVPFEGVFEPFRDLARFAQMHVNEDLGTIAWPWGADLDPEVLYSVVSGTPIEVARPSVGVSATHPEEDEWAQFLASPGPHFVAFLDEVEHDARPHAKVLRSRSVSVIAVIVPEERRQDLRSRIFAATESYFDADPHASQRTRVLHSNEEFRSSRKRNLAAARSLLVSASEAIRDSHARIYHLTDFDEDLQSGRPFEILKTFEMKDPNSGTSVRLDDRKRRALIEFIHGLERDVPKDYGSPPKFFVFADRGVARYEIDERRRVARAENWCMPGLSRHIFNGTIHFTDRSAEVLNWLPDLVGYALRAYWAATGNADGNLTESELRIRLEGIPEGHKRNLVTFLFSLVPIIRPLDRRDFFGFGDDRRWDVPSR